MGSIVKTKGPRWPHGRPTKLTDELIKKITDVIRIGVHVETAVQFAGISKETFYDWIAKGRTRNGIHRRFSDAVIKAASEYQVRDVSAIEAASRGELRKDAMGNPIPGDYVIKPDWRASAWRLERRDPATWANKSVTKIEDNNTPKDDSAFNKENIYSILVDIINEKDE
jgi:transposase